MARTTALSINQAADTKAQLAEIYGYVIENVQKTTISSGLKSNSWSGNPAAGSAEFKRFANSTSNDYGTARTAQKGDLILAPPTTVNLNIHKEIVEEVSKFDLETFGIGSIMARRAHNHVMSMGRELERAFFSQAVTEGTAFTTAETDLKKKMEAYIQTLETVQNNYVDGIPRDIMAMVCNPAFYGLIRDLLDVQSVPNVNTAAEEFGMYHGVRIYSSVYLPAGTSSVLMANESIAMPVLVHSYSESGKIQLSNDFAVELYYDYGVKALTPDLIFKMAA